MSSAPENGERDGGAGAVGGDGSGDATVDDLVRKVLAGDLRTGARLMRDLDDRRPAALTALKALFPHTGRAYIIGVTGNPGAGKSTVVASLIAHYRAAGERVGVVCVDPTSPFSGGAILGDRLRMQRHALDEDVFIRSLATRGHLGGLSRSTFDVASVLDAMGYSRILVETVGVGQDEVDVMRAAHTTAVVNVPGLGDEVQAIKAGLLEIADVLVVNKADREGADRTERDLLHMLELRAHGERKEVELIRTIATRGSAAGSGIAELGAAIERHRVRCWRGEGAAERGLRRRAAQLTELLRALLADRVERALARSGGLAELAASVEAGHRDPWSAAEELLARLGP